MCYPVRSTQQGHNISKKYTQLAGGVRKCSVDYDIKQDKYAFPVQCLCVDLSPSVSTIGRQCTDLLGRKAKIC
jgi:hypothetical protein